MTGECARAPEVLATTKGDYSTSATLTPGQLAGVKGIDNGLRSMSWGTRAMQIKPSVIIRKTGSQKPLVRFACSFSASIDPDRPFKLSAEESKSINELPVVLARQEKVNKRKRKWEEAKLQGTNMAVSHCFKNFEGSLRLQENLELLEDRTMEAKRRYNIAIIAEI
ncbi:hypothetical protein BDV33DRAFT_210830 [Aspergillus novoparasiticus]|uniref:Uncharacterized protein n=1 Tax=Aspergillus novoparasiticus TaxID=986946 RepID=A0A5N6E5H4_9EURO|nr:hypothetical protein BDV33DRAFT_210830 [Aspergillus novoparasiticus]